MDSTAKAAPMLTKDRIDALSPQPARYCVWCGKTPGFGVRVSPTGAKTFIHTYRFGGESRMQTLGQYPGVSVAEARALFHEARAKLSASLSARRRGKAVAEDADPGAVAVRAAAARRVAETVADLVGDYLKRGEKSRGQGKLRPVTLKEYQRLLEVKGGLVDKLGKMRAMDVARKHLVALLDDVADGSGAVSADRMLAAISATFAFGVEKDIVPANPALGIKRKAGKSTKDRALTDDEIAGFFVATDAMQVRHIALALQMILVTGQRPGEVRQMKWSDVDEPAAMWTIPPDIAKNGQKHPVPLSTLAMEILTAAKAIRVSPVYIFAVNKETPLSPKAINVALFRSNIAKLFADAGVARFSPHDLRHTFSTRLGELGIIRFIRERLMNHADRSIAAVYDHFSYEPGKREAVERLATHIRTLTGRPAPVVSNVVPFQKVA